MIEQGRRGYFLAKAEIFARILKFGRRRSLKRWRRMREAARR
jgi:hypothetical protein